MSACGDVAALHEDLAELLVVLRLVETSSCSAIGSIVSSQSSSTKMKTSRIAFSPWSVVRIDVPVDVAGLGVHLLQAAGSRSVCADHVAGAQLPELGEEVQRIGAAGEDVPRRA